MAWYSLNLANSFSHLQHRAHNLVIQHVYVNHNDVTKSKHFLRYWPFVREIPSQMPATRNFEVFLWNVPGQTGQQTIKTPVIGYAIALIANYDVTVMQICVLEYQYFSKMQKVFTQTVKRRRLTVSNDLKNTFSLKYQAMLSQYYRVFVLWYLTATRWIT